ncbi:MAG: beta-lactamase family protein [Gammaproteobacteria bacterium]|nr:beta-lactamase family protein [Gammaproteobacteria bacterium]
MGKGNVSFWPIDGVCDSRFGSLRDAFLTNFTTDGDCGAAVCLMLDGRVAIDLWGGYLDLAHTIPWQRDTLVNAYSVGKGVLSMLALDSIARRELDPAQPLTTVWPELGAAGKDRLSLQMLLSHRSGLPAVRERLPAGAKYDWERICRALAAQAPFWEPDSAHGYHANTFGFLVGEAVARAAGRPLRRLLRERLTAPGELAYYWGVPRRLQPRIAPMLLQHDISTREQQRRAQAQPADDAIDGSALRWRCYFNPPGISGFGAVNTRAWRSAVIPSTNGHTHARALAGLYAAFLSGTDAGLLAEATRAHSDGVDRVLERPSRFGLGFQLNHPKQAMGPGTSAFGHFGYGGSLGMADPDAGLAFAYVTNRPAPRFHVARTSRLLEAIYASL